MTENKVTIDADYFYELFRKANDTDRICKECREEHTAEEFNALERERDELKENLKELSKHDAIAISDSRLAEAERCIEDCFNMCNKEWNATAEIANIIRAYREKKEAAR